MNKILTAGIGALIIVGGLGIAHLIMNKTVDNSDLELVVVDQKNEQRTQENPQIVTDILSDAITVSIDDLQIGDEIGVSGTPNPDGSITAQTIRIGSISAVSVPSGSEPIMIRRPGSSEQSTNGMVAREGGQNDGRMGEQSGRIGMIRGEILEIDDNTITLAVPNGGSQLVFYTSQTTVLKISE